MEEVCHHWGRGRGLDGVGYFIEALLDVLLSSY